MSEIREPGYDFRLFMQQSAWTLIGGAGGDWRRERMDGVAIEIIHVGDKFYQVIANRDCHYARYDRESFRFANMDEAKRRAWLIFNEAKNAVPHLDDGLPVFVEWA